MELLDSMKMVLDPGEAVGEPTPATASGRADDGVQRAVVERWPQWLGGGAVKVQISHAADDGMHQWNAEILPVAAEQRVVAVSKLHDHTVTQRRGSLRVPVDAVVEIAAYPRPQGDGYWTPEVLAGVDLSVTGWAAWLTRPPEEWHHPGRTVALTILLPDGAAIGLARVARVAPDDGGHRIAGEFTHLVEESRRRLAAYVEEASADMRSAAENMAEEQRRKELARLEAIRQLESAQRSLAEIEDARSGQHTMEHLGAKAIADRHLRNRGLR